MLGFFEVWVLYAEIVRVSQSLSLRLGLYRDVGCSGVPVLLRRLGRSCRDGEFFSELESPARVVARVGCFASAESSQLEFSESLRLYGFRACV